MQIPLQLQHKAGESLQSQLFRQLRNLILDGRLKPGSSVPATRELSKELAVSRNTVLLVYERLIAEGYLVTEPAKGTFVSPHLPEDSLALSGADRLKSSPLIGGKHSRKIVFRGRPHKVFVPKEERPSIDFKVGRPDPRSFPIKIWRRLLQKNLDHSEEFLTEYNNPAGLWGLRKAIATHLGPSRGIAAKPEQVLIVAGSQEALNICARLFVSTEAEVVTEWPGYQGAASVFESYGATLIKIPVDNNGIIVDALPRKPISLAYLTPSHQYPLGVTLSLQRRMEILDWASKTGAYLLEDDYDSDFRHHSAPLTALKGLDREDCVIYMGTFSKCMGAALRLGYMVLPWELVETATDIKTMLNNGQPWLDQVIVADFIGEGHFANHLRRIRRTYLTRRDCLVKALREHFGEVKLTGLEGGMHIVWHLPQNLPKAEEVSQAARVLGVGIYSLHAGAACCCAEDMIARQALMIGYSSLTEYEIREGIRRIATALRELGVKMPDKYSTIHSKYRNAQTLLTDSVSP